MNLGNIRLVFLKEIRDTLRDRRTLFISLVLPILLYPLLMIGFSQMLIATSAGIWNRAQRVVVVGGGGAAAERLRTMLGEHEDPLLVVPLENPAVALESGDIEAWLALSDDFSTAIEEKRQGGVTVHVLSSRDASAAAERKVRAVLQAFSRELQKERNVPVADYEPVTVEKKDAATLSERGAKMLGPTLALLLVIMALSGAFYPAIDIMAGEKERGTIETLLVCPARRTEIVLGKYLTVLSVTMTTALLNFASMAITFSYFAQLMPKRDGGIELSISPLMALVIVAALVPLAALFSAVALALSTFARSYKEGQHYLTPMFVAVMPLAMVGLLPETDLRSFALVPVAGAVLLVRDLLMGSAGVTEILLVLGTTALFAGLAIRWTVTMFNREEVLFRDPGGAEFSLFKRSREGTAVPTAGQALVVAAVALVLAVFVTPKLGMASGFLVMQLVFIMGLALGAARWYRVDMRETFSLRVPAPLAWPAAVIGAVSVLVLLIPLLSRVGVDEKAFERLKEAFDSLKDTLGLPLLVLIPPIAEEFLFRGFVLSAFRRKSKAAVAVVVTAALFAVFHLEPAKYLATGLIGIWLGYLVVATGSIWPAILAHLANNGILLLSEYGSVGPWLERHAESPSVGVLAAALVGVVVAVVMLERVRRGRAEKPAEAG